MLTDNLRARTLTNIAYTLHVYSQKLEFLTNISVASGAAKNFSWGPRLPSPSFPSPLLLAADSGVARGQRAQPPNPPDKI